jgi:hypothetical protein
MAARFKTYSILFLLLLPMVVFAQKEVSFVGTANAKQIIMGNHFQVSFILTNANGENFQPPIFKNFKKLSGQNVSSQSSNINGQWETSTTYSYFLQPKKTGKLTIGSANISISGKKYKTTPFSIKAIKGSQTPKGVGNEKEKIFVKAEVNTTEAVPGQQIILDYKVYTAVDVDHYNIIEEPDYSGFFTSAIRRFNGLQTKEVINGIQYTSKTLKRLALYPQQTGLTAIAPMKFRVAVPVNSNGSKTPYTLIRPTKSYILSTNAIEINVSPLPNPIPTSFSGAVGHYKAAVAIDKAAATTDDAITLRITVTGDGDIKRVTAPKLILSDTFEVYDPNVVDEQQLERNGELYGTKTFEYLILPKVPGMYSISPEFSYYDPDSTKFVITHPNTYVINVMKGQYNANVNVTPEIKQKPKQEIKPIKTALKTKSRSSFVGSLLFWILSIFPFLALAGGFIYKYIQDNKPAIDWVAEKSKKAQKVAKQRLSLAEKHLKTGDNRSFYSETSKVLLGYAADKFNISGSELSKSNVQEKLRSSGAKEEHISRFIALIQTCEKAVFAFGTDSDASQTYQDAVGVIADIENYQLSDLSQQTVQLYKSVD